MATAAGSGHPSIVLSLAHIVAGLMYGQMCYDQADPWNRGGDRLVLNEDPAARHADEAFLVNQKLDKLRRLPVGIVRASSGMSGDGKRGVKKN